MHIWRLSKPVIAAVNGSAMGGGFWYQAVCDITIASEQAVFAQPEVRHISNTTFVFAALCRMESSQPLCSDRRPFRCSRGVAHRAGK